MNEYMMDLLRAESKVLIFWPTYTGCGKKGPLKFFAVFPATVWDFNLKFYRFIY